MIDINNCRNLVKRYEVSATTILIEKLLGFIVGKLRYSAQINRYNLTCY